MDEDAPEEKEEDGGGVAPDMDDQYEDRSFAQPQVWGRGH